jgi:nitrite reductase/ring-hydroxylating ferredoxin subunit
MTWHPIVLDHDPADGWTLIDVAGVGVLISLVDGGWFAVEDRCSHAGCAFSADGELDGHTLICDCHGAEFDIRTGEALAMPARTAIRTFPTRVVDGVVEVEL